MNSLPPKISIIIPVYNTEPFLSSCLTSCIRQTLFDIEIVCVNDGSTDGSEKILQEFARADFRIQIINKPNGGLSSARNAGILNSAGEMILFLDSDDNLEPDACEIVWQEVRERQPDIVVFGTNTFPMTPAAPAWYKNNLSVQKKRYSDFSPNVLFKQTGSWPFVWRQAYNRSFLSENDLLFDETIRFGEDTVFQLEAFPHGSKFSFIPDKIYNYRWFRPNSLMEQYNSRLEEKRLQHLVVAETISRYWKEHGWLDSYRLDYLNWMILFLVPARIPEPDPPLSDEYISGVKSLISRYEMDSHLHHLPRKTRKRVKRIL